MAERTAEAKTEEPTAQRLAEARRRGAIVVSRDLLSGVTLILGARAWVGGLVAYLRLALGSATSSPSLAQAGRAGVRALVDGLLLPVGVAVTGALVAGFMQTRGLFSTYPLRFDIRRALPSGRRLFAAAAFGEAGKTLLKAAVVAVVAWWSLRPTLAGLVNLASSTTDSVLAAFGSVAGQLGLRLAVVAVVLGAADYLWQRHRHGKALRMTRDEVKREHKEREGEPLAKAERQRLYRELMQQQAIDEVRRAKLVVVDRDRVAVALAYDPESAGAPVVVAKGVLLMASRIVAAAQEAGVPIVLEGVLARSLAGAEEGSEIPEATHETVATLLAEQAAKPA